MYDSEHDKLVIGSKSERGFWNNDDGWVSAASDATVFERWELGQRERPEQWLPMSAGNDAEWVVIEYID